MVFDILLDKGICQKQQKKTVLIPNNQINTAVKILPSKVHVSETFNIQ